MDHREKRTQSDYSLAFKLAVVSQIEKGELTYKQAQRRFGIQGRSTVLVWLRKHGSQDWSRLNGSWPCGRKTVNNPAQPLTPEQRIKELEAQLKLSKQKAELLESMLDVIRKEYGVKLVKKPFGGSSSKGK